MAATRATAEDPNLRAEREQTAQRKHLVRKRAGKAAYIKKLINEIQRLINERGSRTKIRLMKDQIEKSFPDAYQLHEALMQILDEGDPNLNDEWITSLEFDIQTCYADIAEYLSQREGDPPSEDMSTRSLLLPRNPDPGQPLVSSDNINAWRESTTHFEDRNWLNIEKASSLPGAPSQQKTFVKQVASLPDVPHFGLSLTAEPTNLDIPRHSNTYLVADQEHIERDQTEPISALHAMQNVRVSNADQVNQMSKTAQRRVADEVYREMNVSGYDLEEHRDNLQDSNYPERGKWNHRDETFSHMYHSALANLEKLSAPKNFIDKEFTPKESTKTVHTKYVPAANYDVIDNAEKEHNKITQHRQTKQETSNAADDWIDLLDPNGTEEVFSNNLEEATISFQMLIQQRLPRITIDVFDGAPEKWIDFVIKFHDTVHKQPYLTDCQKRTYLLQHLKGEPLKAVEGFGNDRLGYFSSLKRLKYMFGQKLLVAQAVIASVTRGKQLKDYDSRALSEFYYSVSKCRNILSKMNYHSELNSSDVLRRVIRRLPRWLALKWAEKSFNIRALREPTLVDLELWLQSRIMISKDPYVSHMKFDKQGGNDEGSPNSYHTRTGEKSPISNKCTLCKDFHRLHKCDRYLKKSPKERLKYIKSEKRCFNCLQANHGVKDCSSQHVCFATGCCKKHHTSLHDSFRKPPSDRRPPNNNSNATPQQDSSNDENRETEEHVGYKQNKASRVFLKVVPVEVTGPDNKRISTYALLDGGSQCTLIRSRLANQLGLKGKQQPLRLGTISSTEKQVPSKIVNFKLSSKDKTFKYNVRNAHTLNDDNFHVPNQYLPKACTSKLSDAITQMNLKDIRCSDISILIGADCAKILTCTEIKTIAPDMPHMVKTPFGWTLFGRLNDETKESESHVLQINVSRQNADLNKLVEQFWNTESFEIEFNDCKPLSMQDRMVIQFLDENTNQSPDDHYVVPMLWKKEINLGNNLELAKKRLSYLNRKLHKDENLLKMYKANIDGYLQKGYARKLPPEEVSTTNPKLWYLPHHAVVHANKPGKVRTVFDAAAKYKGHSLNDNLISGPDLMNSLIGILLRFRTHEVAVVADIEAMYYQIRLNEEDRDSVRFLWQDDKSSEIDHYQMLVHILGATCSPCCASYALKRTAKDNLQEFSKDTISTVEKDFYMDDLIKSVETVTKGRSLVQELSKLMFKGGFHLTKFNSTSPEVLEALPQSEKGKAIAFDPDKSVRRALGVIWSINEDTFTFSSDIHINSFTKRGILKTASSIFDPLGLLTPFIFRAKMLIQKLWRMKLDWDEEIPAEMKELFKEWLEDLKNLPMFKVPRWIKYRQSNSIVSQLNIFCDASETGFAAVAYARVIYEDGSWECNLLFSKSRVAPVKRLTLPRLELQGAVLGVKLKAFVAEEMTLNFEQILFWTDSMIVLQYIKSEEGRFKTFVCNRIATIRKHSEPDAWNYVPGKENPADLGTRGCTVKDLCESKLWLNGPSFLQSPNITNWEKTEVDELDLNDGELKKPKSCQMVIQSQPEPVIDFLRFSSWDRLVHTASWIMVYANNLRRGKKVLSETFISRQIKLEEVDVGETLLIKLIQRELYSEEQTTSLKPLDPFIDAKGIMRVGGRLKYSRLPYAARHQIILPYRNHAVKLLVEHFHKRNHHWGKELLLSTLRQKYWIVKGRSFVRSVINSCVLCKRKQNASNPPIMANLPPTRLAISSPPFTHSGVDYFGPMQVKVLRSRAKRWGCIFTCLTTRAVHLELVESLSTDSFINTLERFINRRGTPSSITSDCATNFKGADNEMKHWLKEMENDQKLKNFNRRNRIFWHFNPPEAPHMGGAWERLIRSVKTALKIVLGNAVVNDYTLMTWLTGVESLVNSRPLTIVSDDVNDLEALTPSHFLLGRGNFNLAPTTISEDQIDDRARWKQVQAMTNQFWSRWVKEYAPTVTTRSKWCKRTTELASGDLVLIKDEKTERGIWPLGRIVKTYESKDGVVRKVDVKTKNGIYTRPVHKLSKI